jgi:hypothetical protein
MAVTIIEQPQSHTPIYNDMVVLLSSNLTSNPKFLFGLDVYITIEGLGDQFIGRLKSPNVVNLYSPSLAMRGFFNIKELIKSSGAFATKSNYFIGDISHPIKLIPGEEYAASASGVATYYPSSANVQYVGFNGSLRLDEFRQFVPTDLINTTTIAASSGIGQYIMSSYTQPKNILKSTLNELTFLCNGGTNTRAIVSYYNVNALISTQTVAVTTANKTDITVNGSFNALAVPTNATRYTIALERISNGNDLSPTYSYNLVDACSKYPTLNVYFQNKWGAYDSFIFNKKSTKRDSINRKTYQKQDRYINTYNSYDPAIRTYDSEIKTRHTLSTDWVTEEEMTWLSELVESNNVQFSYDSEFILGRKAEVTITVSINPDGGRWYFDPYGQEMTATMGAISLSAIFPASSVTQYDFADEFYFDKIKPVILASNWATYFDIDESGVTAEAIVFKMVAKQKGTAFNLTSPYAGSGGIVGSQMSASNNILGINEVLPNTIPIQIEDTSFEFKTRDNDKLFQLTINAVETSVYNRQNL